MMRVSIAIGPDVDVTVKIDDPYSPDVLEDLISRTVIGAVSTFKAEQMGTEAT